MFQLTIEIRETRSRNNIDTTKNCLLMWALTYNSTTGFVFIVPQRIDEPQPNEWHVGTADLVPKTLLLHPIDFQLLTCLHGLSWSGSGSATLIQSKSVQELDARSPMASTGRRRRKTCPTGSSRFDYIPLRVIALAVRATLGGVLGAGGKLSGVSPQVGLVD